MVEGSERAREREGDRDSERERERERARDREREREIIDSVSGLKTSLYESFLVNVIIVAVFLFMCACECVLFFDFVSMPLFSIHRNCIKIYAHLIHTDAQLREQRKNRGRQFSVETDAPLFFSFFFLPCRTESPNVRSSVFHTTTARAEKPSKKSWGQCLIHFLSISSQGFTPYPFEAGSHGT